MPATAGLVAHRDSAPGARLCPKDQPWSLDILNALRSHFSLPFPDTLSHTLSELPEFTSNVRSLKPAGLRQSTGFCGPGGVLDQYLRQKICLGGSGCREGIAGRDRDKCRQGNAAQDQRHGGWILNLERQSDDKVRKLLDSSRQDVQTAAPGQACLPRQFVLRRRQGTRPTRLSATLG